MCDFIKDCISVIVPIYNVEKYLNHCIESIIDQTYHNIEIILIDDGSTDSSSIICDTYVKRDTRIKVIHKENGGVSSARNVGLKNASGEFIAFVDADDIVDHDYLLNLYKYKEYDYVVSGLVNRYLNFNGEYEDYLLQAPNLSGKDICDFNHSFFINGFIHSSCGKLYRTNIIRNRSVKFPEYRLSEDTFFNLNYIEHISSFMIIEKANYYYLHRKNEKSATKKIYLEDINIYINLHKKMKKLNISKSIVNSTIYAQYLAICLKVLRQNKSDKEKIEDLRIVLSNKIVKNTLITTKNNIGEYLTGLIICTLNIKLINLWFNFVKSR